MNVYLGELYKEVEYIQSSGNGDNTGQYINTGLSIKNGESLKVEIDFQYLNNTTAERDIFSYYVDSTNDYILGFRSGGFFGILNSTTNGTLPTTRTPNTYATNTRYKVIAEGITKTSSKSPFLFASNGGNDNLGDWDISAKLYYCKVRQNNVLVRDFVPCYRKSDSVIGLFDKVENKFYTNAGTGTFSKGSDVGIFQPELKNAYIGALPPLVLQKVLDFTTNSWGDFTMTPTDNGSRGLAINTSGGYCYGLNSAYSGGPSGNGNVWKIINAKRFWGRIKFQHVNSKHGGISITILPDTAHNPNFTDCWHGGLYTDENKFYINLDNTEYAASTYSIVLNTYYYLDFKFDNGLCTCILYDSNMTELKKITYQSTATTMKFSGFNMRGGVSGYADWRVYEYREAYDNN